MVEPIILKNSQLEVMFDISNDLKMSRLKTDRGEYFSPSLPATFVGPHLQQETPLSAPWQYTLLGGVLKAESRIKGLVLTFRAELKGASLQMTLSAVSEADSLVGFCFFFPRETLQSIREKVEFDLKRREVVTGRPPNLLDGRVELMTTKGPLSIQTSCLSAENSWLLDNSQESVVSLTVVSSEDPFAPNLTVSTIDIALQIG